MNFSTVRKAIKNAIATIEGLNVDDLRDTPNAPCCIVIPDVPMQYDVDFDHDQQPKFRLLVLLPNVNTQNAQEALDVYISDVGPQSIKAVVEKDEAIKAVTSSVAVTELVSYGIISLREGGVEYLSAELICEVYV